MRRLVPALLLAGCFGGEAPPPPAPTAPGVVTVSLAEFGAHPRTDPRQLRTRIAELGPRTVVLLGEVPRFEITVGDRILLTDVPYGDLDGDGVPETAVTRDEFPATEPTRPVDPRIHAEARLMMREFGVPRIDGLRCLAPSDVPARFANEILEHIADSPAAPLARRLAEARVKFVAAHPGLAQRLREAVRDGRAPDDPELGALLATQCYGPAEAAPPPAPSPFRRATDLTVEANEWNTHFDIYDDEDAAVLSLVFDVLAEHRATDRLKVFQSDELLYTLDAGAETAYSAGEPFSLGGRVSAHLYRGRFLLPLRGHSHSTLKVTHEGGGAIRLMPGTGVDVWPSGFAPLWSPPDGGIVRTAPPLGPTPSVVRATVTLLPEARFTLVNLSAALNRPRDDLKIGKGSFAGWFEGDRVEHAGVPFRVEPKVLVSPNDTENVFELAGFDRAASRIHLLVWGYGLPPAHVPIVVRFEDGKDRMLSLALEEWTQPLGVPAFDFPNSGGYAHAAIYHQTLEVVREARITRIESTGGTFGLVAITFEE